MEVADNQIALIKIGGGRNPSISFVRFIAMIMIILCHMFQYYDNEFCRWLNVGVQIFFTISGYLYGVKEFPDPIAFIKKSYVKILLPYYLFLLIALFLYFIYCPSEISIVSVIKALFCAGTISGLGHLWFVGYILFCYLLAPYLYWLRKSIPQSYSWAKVSFIYATILVLFQVIGFVFDCYFQPDFVSCYIIGFLAADMFNRFGKRVNLGILVLFAVFAIFFNCVEVWVKYIGQIEISGNMQMLFNAWCRYAHLFLGVALFFVMNKLFSSMKYSMLLLFTDKYSYPVYIVHLIFILSPFTLMSLTSSNIVNWLIVVLAIIISGVTLQEVASSLISIVSK